MAEPGTSDETLLKEAVVSVEVAAALHKHMVDQGRHTEKTPRDFMTILGRISAREWGTTNARRFSDAAGGGWLIDMSDYFDNEELYAIVRSVHGSRIMSAVVESEEVEAFGKNGVWQSAAARGNGVSPDVAAEAEAIEAGNPAPATAPARPRPQEGAQAAPRAAAQGAADDPMLIVYWATPGPPEESLFAGAQMSRCKRADVPEIVRALLAAGFEVNGVRHTVTESTIEVWSSVSRPRVEVRF